MSKAQFGRIMYIKNEDNTKQKKIILELMSSDIYKPMKAKQLAVLLNIEKSRRGELQRVLDELIDEGSIAFNKKGEYRLRKNTDQFPKNTVTGTFLANSRGFGFVRPENGTSDDVFILSDDINGAMDGDVVLIRVKSGHVRGDHESGKVLKVISHKHTEYVGRYVRKGSDFYVTSDDPKIIKALKIDTKKGIPANLGDKVIAQITKYAEKNKHAVGYVKTVLGNENDPGIDILSKIYSKGIETEFSADVVKEAKKCGVSVPLRAKEDRKDLTSQMSITIDGEDAKDLDDAVYAEKTADGFKLWVHIADVSNYVKNGSRLDQEAYKRGTSIYLPDRVIPMLPKELSNGICSLNAGVDRLALSCEMSFDSHGDMLDHEIYESVINVSRRMNYTEINAIIEDHDEEISAKNEEYLDMISVMAELSKLIRKKRVERGAVDFDFPEARIVLNEDGSANCLEMREANSATRLIEDFMLSANEAVAGEFYERDIPFIYRVHDVPDGDSIENLLSILYKNGFSNLKKGHKITAAEIQNILNKTQGNVSENLVKRMMLRAMSQAKYSTDNTGHFALCAADYCHFTSPIRRYPDLMIHRIIKEYLHGGNYKNAISEYHGNLENVAVNCSVNERNAESIEREVTDMKKAEYALLHKGEFFTGVISSVTSWGFYVELSNTLEGLVSNSSLHGDFYDYDDKAKTLTGRRNKEVFKIGDMVRIKIADAHKEDGTIDFKFKSFI